MFRLSTEASGEKQRFIDDSEKIAPTTTSTETSTENGGLTAFSQTVTPTAETVTSTVKPNNNSEALQKAQFSDGRTVEDSTYQTAVSSISAVSDGRTVDKRKAETALPDAQAR